MERNWTVLALGLAVLAGFAGSARAQSAEANALGLQISQTIFRSLPLEDVLERGVAGAPGTFNLKTRPEWKAYLSDALKEEFRHDMPAIERIFGRTLAKTLTIEELRVGNSALRDPALQAALRGQANSRPSRETQKLLQTAAGQSFLTKLRASNTMLDPMLDEVMIELAPGALRRFADKVDADEAERRAAQAVK